MVFVSQSNLQFEKSQIAVAISPGAFGAHLGVVFESAKEGRKLLHLEFHLALRTVPFSAGERREAPASHQASVMTSGCAVVDDKVIREAAQDQEHHAVEVCWLITVVDLPVTVSKVVVGIARAVSKRGPKIHFGIDFIAAQGSFDANGAYRSPRGSHGLTCASFVNELFRAAAVSLIDVDTWKRKGDFEVWKNGVIKLLQIKNAEPSHIQAVIDSDSKLRLCPEELAAAAASSPSERPMAFERAQQLAPQVMADVETQCPTQMAQVRLWAEQNLQGKSA